MEANVVTGQDCPMCSAKELTLQETEREIPYFGIVYVFSMTCAACKYHKADLEAKEQKPPAKWTFEVENEEDLQVRIIKSASATVKIPRMITMEHSETSNGYVTNVEGLLNRIKRIMESARDNEDDPKAKKQAKNHLKKLQKVMWGQEKMKIIIEDKTGNSAIISEKAVKSKA